MEFFPKLVGLLIRPSATLERLKVEEKFEQAFVYLLLLSVVGATLTGAILALGFIWLLGSAATPGISPFAGGALLGLLSGLFAFIVLLVGAILWGLWMHIWVYAFGGRGVGTTLQAMMYAFTPRALFGALSMLFLSGLTLATLASSSAGAAPSSTGFWIFILAALGFSAFVWQLALFARGVRVFHGFTRDKAFAATLVGGVIPLGGTVVLAAIIAAFVLRLGAPVSAPGASVKLVAANETYLCIEHQGGDPILLSNTRLSSGLRTYTYDGNGDCFAFSGEYDRCTGPLLVLRAGDASLLTLGGPPLSSASSVAMVDAKSSQQIARFDLSFTLRSGPLRCP